MSHAPGDGTQSTGANQCHITSPLVQHGHETLVATVNVVLHKTGKAKIELVLTRKGRNLLKRTGRMTLAAHGGFTPVGRGTTSASRTITLVR